MPWDPFKEGASIEPLVTPPITPVWLQEYATISGDWNPIHLDPQSAIEAGFEGAIAHGMLSMGMMTTLITPWLNGSTIIKKFQTRFQAPLMVGDCLHVSGKVIKKSSEGSITTVHLEGRNQREELILNGTITLEAK